MMFASADLVMISLRHWVSGRFPSSTFSAVVSHHLQVRSL